MAKKDTGPSEGAQSATEGAHPAVPISEGADAEPNKKYADNPDKPDPNSVAQVEVTDS